VGHTFDAFEMLGEMLLLRGLSGDVEMALQAYVRTCACLLPPLSLAYWRWPCRRTCALVLACLLATASVSGLLPYEDAYEHVCTCARHVYVLEYSYVRVSSCCAHSMDVCCTTPGTAITLGLSLAHCCMFACYNSLLHVCLRAIMPYYDSSRCCARYEAAISHYPRRYVSLAGAARCAVLLKDDAKATLYYGELLNLTAVAALPNVTLAGVSQSNCTYAPDRRPALADALAFFNNTRQTTTPPPPPTGTTNGIVWAAAISGVVVVLAIVGAAVGARRRANIMEAQRHRLLYGDATTTRTTTTTIAVAAATTTTTATATTTNSSIAYRTAALGMTISS
jgi:hypothetical protein